MQLTQKEDRNSFVLKGFFEEDKLTNKNILTTKFVITEYVETKQAFICLGARDSFDLNALKEVVNKIVKLNTREFNIIAKTFTNEKVSLENVVTKFVDINEYVNGEGLYSAKTTKLPEKVKLSLVVSDEDLIEKAKTTLTIAKLVNNARRWQATPPNICNSEWLAKDMQYIFKGVSSNNIKIKVLNKEDIEQEKMGLFLSVNKGSAYEPRLVVIEYNGNPKSKEKIAYIGKGITFDSGGYNLKGTPHIKGMKFDMSGAAICASVMRGLVELNPKVNVCAVLPLTDNKISSNAQTPDSIWTSMSGKTVEVNNTDAEGRLILADAITYAIRKFKPTQIVDIATLTGAIIVCLGTTYTGVWSTCNKMFEKFQNSADKQDELIWRLPFHDDFIKNIKASNFADYKNTDFSGKGGSISAAMFLKEFTENINYIHLDIAGSGGDGDNPTGVMVKTLIQFALDSQEEN